MTMTPTTVTIYTNEWVRIAGRRRPSLYLIAVGAAAFVPGFIALLTIGNWITALEVASIGLVLSSVISILMWRKGASTEINLGAEKIRFGKEVTSFADITDLDLHNTSGNLYVLADEKRVLLPLFWLSHSQIKVIERMVRLLTNASLPEGRAEEIRDHLREMLSN